MLTLGVSEGVRRTWATQTPVVACPYIYSYHPYGATSQAAMLTLGVSETDVGDADASFGQLGGDSLAAIQFAREVSELCGVSLPVSFVLDHSHSLKDITEKARAPAAPAG